MKDNLTYGVNHVYVATIGHLLDNARNLREEEKTWLSHLIKADSKAALEQWANDYVHHGPDNHLAGLARSILQAGEKELAELTATAARSGGQLRALIDASLPGTSHTPPGNTAADRKADKINELYTDLVTFYVRNIHSLSPSEREDYSRLEMVHDADSFLCFAKNINGSPILPEQTDISLAREILSADRATLDMAAEKIATNSSAAQEKFTAAENIAAGMRNTPDKPLVIFRNGKHSYTVLGEDARILSNQFGWTVQRLRGSDSRNAQNPSSPSLAHVQGETSPSAKQNWGNPNSLPKAFNQGELSPSAEGSRGETHFPSAISSPPEKAGERCPSSIANIPSLLEMVGERYPGKAMERTFLNLNRGAVALIQSNNISHKVTNSVVDLGFLRQNDHESTYNKNRMIIGALATIAGDNVVRLDTGSSFLETGKDGSPPTTLIIDNGHASLINAHNDSLDLGTYSVGTGGILRTGNHEAQLANALCHFLEKNFVCLYTQAMEYGATRQRLDRQLTELIEHNDKIAKDNPDTIILFKQKGFIEAFSESAVKTAETLDVPLYNRSDHGRSISVPFAAISVDQYRDLVETDNNVYLAKPKNMEKMTEMNLRKISNGETARIHVALRHDADDKRVMTQTASRKI